MAPLSTPTLGPTTPTDSDGVTAEREAKYGQTVTPNPTSGTSVSWESDTNRTDLPKAISDESYYHRTRMLELALGQASTGESTSVTLARATAYLDWINMSANDPLEVSETSGPLEYFPTLESRDIPVTPAAGATSESVPEPAPVAPVAPIAGVNPAPVAPVAPVSPTEPPVAPVSPTEPPVAPVAPIEPAPVALTEPPVAPPVVTGSPIPPVI